MISQVFLLDNRKHDTAFYIIYDMIRKSIRKKKKKTIICFHFLYVRLSICF